MDAYVYLRAEPGRVEDVVVALAGKHGVRHAVAVVGDWDVMVAVEGRDFQHVARTLMDEIHPIEGVTRTYTTPVVPLESMGIHGGGWAMPTLPLHREGHGCYVHIRTTAGSVASVVETLGGTEHIEGVAVIAGEYDVLAEIALPWEQASRVILEVIHAIPGVLSTSTAIGVAPSDDANDL